MTAGFTAVSTKYLSDEDTEKRCADVSIYLTIDLTIYLKEG
jgi:hypothetical protein